MVRGTVRDGRKYSSSISRNPTLVSIFKIIKRNFSLPANCMMPLNIYRWMLSLLILCVRVHMPSKLIMTPSDCLN